jgi:DNA repair protein RadC
MAKSSLALVRGVHPENRASIEERVLGAVFLDVRNGLIACRELFGGTCNLGEAARLLGLKLTDHLVLGAPARWTSLQAWKPWDVGK